MHVDLSGLETNGNDIDGGRLLQTEHGRTPALELVDLFASLDIPELQKQIKISNDKILYNNDDASYLETALGASEENLVHITGGVDNGRDFKGSAGKLQLRAQLLTLNVPNLQNRTCLLYTSPSPRDLSTSRMPSSA